MTQRQPVIGEQRIRGIRSRGIVENMYVDTRLLQGVNIAGEFGKRKGLCCIRDLRGLLEIICDGGFLINGKGSGTNHENTTGCLHFSPGLTRVI